MQRFLAISCLLSLAIQPASAQPRKEAVSFAIPAAMLSAPPPISRRPSAVTHKQIRDLSQASYPRTHYQRGMYYRQKGELNSALIEFLKATQENPRLVRAFYEQSLIFHQRGYLKLAESALEQALAVDADYKQARVLLATIRLAQGNVGGAVSELSRTLGLPENKKPQINLDNEVPADAIVESEAKELERPMPPPSLLQVLHNILPVPDEEPPAASVQPATPAAEQSSGADRKIGFAGLPTPPVTERKIAARGELDDILTGIPGLDPNMPDTQPPASNQAAGKSAEAPSSTTESNDNKALSESIPHKKSGFHFHFPNPLSGPFLLFKNVDAKPEPSVPPKADRLEKKAEKLKVKADNLRERADRLSPATDRRNQPADLSNELASPAKEKLAKAMAESQSSSTSEKNESRPNRQKKNKSGFFSGLFTIFESSGPEQPNEVKDKKASAGDSNVAKTIKPGPESEPLAMVVRQPLAANSETAAVPARHHLPIPLKRQRHAAPSPAQFASLSQLKQFASPPPPSLQNQPASITVPVPAKLSTDSNPNLAPLPVPQNNLSRTLVIETPVPAQSGSTTNRSGSFSPLPAALKALGISANQTPAPKAEARTQYTTAPAPMEISRYDTGLPALQSTLAAPPVKPDKHSIPAPIKVPASLLDPTVMSFAASNAAQQKATEQQARQHASSSAAAPPSAAPPNTQPQQAPIKTQLVYSPPAAHPSPVAITTPAAAPAAPPQPTPPASNTAQTGSSTRKPFQSPVLPSGQMRWLSLPQNDQQRSAATDRSSSAPAARTESPDEDAWTKRLRYLSEHGTTSLKPGEAFMFSEETGEAVLFMSKGETIRRKVAQPQDPEEVVRARRPDILVPQELQYNLSLLGKLLPKPSGEPQAQQSQGADPLSNFNISDVLRNSNRFWDWLKQSVRF